MEINGKKYGFTIKPRFGYVNAEIYEVTNIKFTDGKFMELHLLSRDFGSAFRTPNENDYKKAREWVDLQMNGILTANTIY